VESPERSARAKSDPAGAELLDSIRTIIRLARIAQQTCDELGLTLPQYRALNHNVRGPHRAFELARYSAVSRPAMSALTSGLERMGLLERHDDEVDGRGVHFVTTEQGRQVFAEVEDRLVERFRAVLGPAEQALRELDTVALETALERQTDRDFGPSDSTAAQRTAGKPKKSTR
jgi:DNA-binding MarR family transcriptional regulator